MTATVLERETSNYWNLIKNVRTEAKPALISILSNSLIDEMPRKAETATSADSLLDNVPKDVPLTDEDIMQEVKAMRYAV